MNPGTITLFPFIYSSTIILATSVVVSFPGDLSATLAVSIPVPVIAPKYVL